MSQNPETKDYIIALQNIYCEKCSEKYTNVFFKWCKPCQINNLKNNITNWISENKQIDNLIQKKQLEIDYCSDRVFEWIPYDQFSYIKEIGKGGFATVYSAVWSDGPLEYKNYNEEYTRSSNYKVALKCLHNSQNITNE